VGQRVGDPHGFSAGRDATALRQAERPPLQPDVLRQLSSWQSAEHDTVAGNRSATGGLESPRYGRQECLRYGRRRAFAQRLEGRRREDLGAENRRLERGWFVGDAEFRQELLEPVVPVPGTRHCGEAVQAEVAVQAERLVQDRLQALGWQEEDLTTRRKGDPAKVKLAAVVRAQTIMPLAWIAKRLAMGSRGYLTWLLYRQAKPS
jgi:hypothetical protein